MVRGAPHNCTTGACVGKNAVVCVGPTIATMKTYELQSGLVVDVCDDAVEGCRVVADEVVALLAQGPKVLGLATGATPQGLYEELVRRHRAGLLSFAEVTSFNLDEYVGLDREHPESYWHFMQENLFRHVDVAAGAVHVPGSGNGTGASPAEYEETIRQAGGLDWQLLGIGRTGHIGFNEPGSDRETRTRRVALAPETREDAAPAFGGLENVPEYAVSMGVGTILEARRIVMMAWGDRKAEIVERALCGDVGPEVPASYLQEHGNVRIVLDRDSGAWLCR